MFKIGEFSRISQVTVQTLRHYDEIGLLKPSYVDRTTGYRYYSLDVLPRLNRILALKDLGLSLDEIALMLRNDVSYDELQTILRLKLTELAVQQQETEARIKRVNARLHWIEREHEMPIEEVVLKSVDTIRVLAIRRQVPTWADIPDFFGEVTAATIQHKLTSAGAWIAIYHDTEWVEQNIDFEIALPMGTGVSADLPLGSDEVMKVSQLPMVERMASLLYQGVYEAKGDAIVALGHWIESNGYQFAGPVREVYLRGPMDTNDPMTYLTEIQAPVKQKS